MLFQWLKDKKLRRAAASRLYQTTLRQSRDPAFYASWAVSDTMDGRFDVLSLHVALVMERLARFGAPGRKLSQALFDAMFRDIDLTLRETGVGDLGVPKHMARMMKAFNGRAHAYHMAVAAGDRAALRDAIARNIYRTETPPAQADMMTDYALWLHDVLGAQPLDQFMDGTVHFTAQEERRAASHG